MSGSKIQTTQQIQQQISSQQIQFLELLQLSAHEIERRIENEMEENPVLEEDIPTEEPTVELNKLLAESNHYGHSPTSQQSSSQVADTYAHQIASTQSLSEHLLTQLGFLSLPAPQQRIAEQLIGSLEEDGYLRRPLLSIAHDLRKTGLQVEIKEIENVLHQVQRLDPAGIAARTLQECLLIQLVQLPLQPTQEQSIRIIRDHYKAFTKKHFKQIAQRLHLPEKDAKESLQLIMRLDPKPGAYSTASSELPIYYPPDFILRQQGKKLEVHLRQISSKRLRASHYYIQMLRRMQKEKNTNSRTLETIRFIKRKAESAKWFIQALHQREQTLLGTARMVIERQADFLSSGDTMKLKPLILLQVAENLKVDVSTISRIVNNKRIQTPFGIFTLRYFFSQAISTDQKQLVSNRAIKALLQQLIDSEDKRRPLVDEALHRILKEKGYTIARRTVAKYRELLQIPPARLRKEW